MLKPVFLFFVIILISFPTSAVINFKAEKQDSIDIESVAIDKDKFFDFLDFTIMNRPPGLGAYGTVSFHPCDMKIDGQKLIDYNTPDGKEIKYISNPSCDQIVIRRVIENSYQYKKSAIKAYQNRQCLLSIEKIISPILEYYTLKYEERKQANCSICDFKEKERLDLIFDTQKKIVEHCQLESDHVMKFITDLDAKVEAIYKTKTSKK